jgi:hypothetical protein
MCDWQGIGRSLKVAEADQRPPEQVWLFSEYIRYLKEEGLSDPDALTAASALALMESRSAEDAVSGICEHADAALQADWTRGAHQETRGSTPSAAFGRGYWANYAPIGTASHRPELARSLVRVGLAQKVGHGRL